MKWQMKIQTKKIKEEDWTDNHCLSLCFYVEYFVCEKYHYWNDLTVFEVYQKTQVTVL